MRNSFKTSSLHFVLCLFVDDQAKYVLSTRKNSVQGLGKIETDQILGMYNKMQFFIIVAFQELSNYRKAK